MSDCTCGLDGEMYACIEGAVYGPCEHEHCGGICEYEGDCRCTCHQRQNGPTDPEGRAA